MKHTTLLPSALVSTRKPYLYTHTPYFINHLEHLGYDIELTDDTKADTYIARNPAKYAMTLSSQVIWTAVTSSFIGYSSERCNDTAFWEELNSINKRTSFSTWVAVVYDKTKLQISIAASYPEYNKRSFGMFIDIFNQEIALNIHAFAPYLKEQI
ncbi:MAG: hypothetical protein NVSMB46_02150 [Candidatus Saccharimonadales bacterium]